MTAEKLLFTKKESATSLGVSTRSVEYYIARGDLLTRRIGRRILVTAASLRRFAGSDHPDSVRRKKPPAAAPPPTGSDQSDAPKTGQ